MPVVPVLALLLVSLLAPVPAAADPILRERIARLSAGNALVGGVELASGTLLADLYRQQDYRLAWDPKRVEALLRLIEAARRDGFNRSDFHFREIGVWLNGGDLNALPPMQRAELDILLSDSLLRYIHHHRFGKVNPVTLDPNWNHVVPPAFGALQRDLREALGASDLEAHIKRLIREPPFYVNLREGLARYRRIASQGGWPMVAEGASVKPGMQDTRVPSIRDRLRATGEYAGGDPPEPLRYDSDLQTAVERFQEHHGLAKDGVVGPQTRRAMNVTVEQRIDQIRINLERMRWVANGLPEDFLLVDIAGYRVNLFRRGQSVLSTRAIVGKPERMTPVFRDELAYLEFNPTWTVPPTILAEDILPKMRTDPGYIRTRGLRVVDRAGREVPAKSVNWNLSPQAFPYSLRQDPSDENALGRVKFMFPNRFSVYLHDTPTRSLFNRTERAFSSGCVRVEEPLRLAELVLDDPQRWNNDSFNALLDSRQSRVVRLKKPLPVLFSYWTAEADAHGNVRFRPDIYARDDQILQALDGGLARPRIAPAPTGPRQSLDATSRSLTWRVLPPV